MRREAGRRRVWAACGLLISVIQTGAWGQTVSAASPAQPEQAIQEGLRRQEERSREQQKTLEPKADELRPDRPAPPKPGFPAETLCFQVSEIVLGGKDAGRFGWLVDAALPYLRRCVGVQGLAFISAQLDQALRDQGFATSRVSLPPQNLQGGQLLIHVEAGRVADVRMVVQADAGSAAPAQTPDVRWGTWRNAFPLSTGDILDVRDLEQGVENMKRLPSQNVVTRLEPGDAPGTSIVYIERKTADLRERVRGGLTVDNSGGSSLGRAQLSASAALDNPTGLNDVLNVTLNTNAQQPTASHRSQSASVQYSVPWGYNLLSLSTSNSRFAQYVQGTTVRFLSSGRSASAEARLSRTLWRGASSKLGVYASVSTRRAVSYLDDVEVVVQRRRTTNLETGANYKHIFENASLELDLALRRGMPWHGAQDDLASAAEGGLTLRPRIWTWGGNLSTGFHLAGRSVQYTATMRGQRTRDMTLSVDQMAIGGRSSVRGFDGDAVLIAENGLTLRNELATPFKLGDTAQGQVFAALDYGRVWGPSDIFLAGRQLAGMALGVRGRQGSRQLEATLAAPLYHPSGFDSRNLNLYLSLTQEF